MAQHRKLDKEALYCHLNGPSVLAEEALRLKLVDRYLDILTMHLREAKVLASLPDNSRIIVYHQTKHRE